MLTENKIVFGQYIQEFGKRIFCEEFDIDFKKISQYIRTIQKSQNQNEHFILCVNRQQKFLLRFQTIDGQLYLQHYSLDMRPLIPFMQNKLFAALNITKDQFEDISNPRLQNSRLDLTVNPSLGGWIKEDLRRNFSAQLQDALMKLKKPFSVKAPAVEATSAKKNGWNVFKGLKIHSMFNHARDVNTQPIHLQKPKRFKR